MKASPHHLDFHIDCRRARKVFLAGTRVSVEGREGIVALSSRSTKHGVEKDFPVVDIVVDFGGAHPELVDIALVDLIPWVYEVDGALQKGDKVVMLSDPYEIFGGEDKVGKVFTLNRRSFGSFVSARGLGRAHLSHGSSGERFFAVVGHHSPAAPAPAAPAPAAPAPAAPAPAAPAPAAPAVAKKPESRADSSSDWFSSLSI